MDLFILLLEQVECIIGIICNTVGSYALSVNFEDSHFDTNSPVILSFDSGNDSMAVPIEVDIAVTYDEDIQRGYGHHCPENIFWRYC